MSTPRELRVLLHLARAQLSSRSARVRFQDTERSTAERTVDVLALSYDPPRWVAATWSPERGSLRLLDVARILRVRATRRRAATPPAAFDPVHFVERHWFSAGVDPPEVQELRLAPPWDSVARALLPTAEVSPDPRGGVVVRVRTSRPAVVNAFAESLAAIGTVDSDGDPWSERKPSPTRRASSASPPGSSPAAPRSPARRSGPRSRSTTAGSPTRRSGSSRGTRTR